MPIYIAAHQPAALPVGPLYRNLALGGVDLGVHACSDSDGDNIADLNRYYCELTGTYWIWKNAVEDVVGLCHYRRYFNLLPVVTNDPVLPGRMDDQTRALLEHPGQQDAVHQLLGQYDLIVPRAVFTPMSVADCYRVYHGDPEWDAFIVEMDRLYGRHGHSLDVERRFYVGNMLICRKDLFDLYASELFAVLDAVFRRIGILPAQDGARYQPYRYPGYLGERFTSAFIKAHRLTCFEAQTVFIE